jgi:hypothetical protein
MSVVARLARRIRPRWIDNWRALRRAADLIGREFEAKSYAELCGPADNSCGERTIDGLAVEWSAYLIEVRPDGEAFFCVDVRAPLRTWFGAKPSYQFVKRPDGSIHYN